MQNISDDILRRLNAFNNWLPNAYDDDISFNILLLNAGFNEAEIEQLKREHLSKFLQAIADILIDNANPSSERRSSLIILHYGLGDGRPQSLEKIAHDVGVSPERIFQLVNKQTGIYRDPMWQAKFQNDFAVIGRQLLDTEK